MIAKDPSISQVLDDSYGHAVFSTIGSGALIIGGQGGGGNVPEDTPSTGPTGPVEVPEEFADASDDDVIARQLREAAMAEQDPALREKLWEEYRRYKANGA
jgi:hypothetical protein